MRVVVKKWGNSAAVRIPATVLNAAGVKLDQPVDVREEGGSIVIEPVRSQVISLDAMIADITDANRHGVVDMQGAVGREVW